MKRRKKFKEINITNLVDVSLTILIVFIITAPMMTPGIDVNLVKVDSTLPRDEEGITISINNKKEIFIEEKKIDNDRFIVELDFLLKKKPPNVIVYIKADKNIEYGFVLETIGMIKKLGVNEVGLVGEKEDFKKNLKKLVKMIKRKKVLWERKKMEEKGSGKGFNYSYYLNILLSIITLLFIPNNYFYTRGVSKAYRLFIR